MPEGVRELGGDGQASWSLRGAKTPIRLLTCGNQSLRTLHAARVFAFFRSRSPTLSLNPRGFLARTIFTTKPEVGLGQEAASAVPGSGSRASESAEGRPRASLSGLGHRGTTGEHHLADVVGRSRKAPGAASRGLELGEVGLLVPRRGTASSVGVPGTAISLTSSARPPDRRGERAARPSQEGALAESGTMRSGSPT